MYVPVKTLPDCLQSVLKSVGYYGADLKVETAEVFTPTGAYGDGYRALTVALDLNTGESKQTTGDYGGGWGITAQDRAAQNNEQVKIPEGAIFLSVQSGPKVFVTAYAAPSTFVPYLPKEKIEVSYLEKCVLFAHRAYKSSYRQEYYNEKGISDVGPLIASLAVKGFLKVNKAGSSQITTEGKNLVEHYSGGGRGPQETD